jgi:hypothetical protein
MIFVKSYVNFLKCDTHAQTPQRYLTEYVEMKKVSALA